jgi:hypothetical protein
MQSARDARAHALVLLEVGEEDSEHKRRALAVAEIWVTLAILEDALTLWMDQVKRETTIH